MTTRRLLKKCILILFLAVFLITGFYYAYTRDLSNGNNKIYVDPGERAGQIVLSQRIVQRFVPGHDFDGISLLIDHNRSAMPGTVTVRIYRSSDNTCELTRTLPVYVISGKRYTFFAGSGTIAADMGEEFYAEVEYSGPSSGMVVAITGEMPDSVAGMCTIGDGISVEKPAMGIVTDYQYNPAYVRLMQAAFVILAGTIGALAYGQHWIRRNRIRGRLIFFAAYYACITAFLMIAVTMSAEHTYTPIWLGNYDESEIAWQIKDDGSLDAVITMPVDDICGIHVPIAVPSGYLFTSETLTVQVQDALISAVLQTESYALSDILDGSVYIPLDDRYDSGTRLMLHFVSNGMAYAKCLGFYSTEAGDSGNSVYYGGEKQEGQVAAMLYQTTMVHSYGRILLFYGVAVVIGLVLAWLLFRKRIPLILLAGHRDLQAGQMAAESEQRAQRRRKRLLAWLVVTILFGVLMMDYVYAEAVRGMQDLIYPELVCYSADGIHDWSELRQDEEITQTVVVGNDMFSGIGLMLSDNISDTNSYIVDAEIRVTFTDDEGAVLDEVQYQVQDMEYIRSILGEDYLVDLPLGFQYVPLHTEVNIPQGTELTVHIKAYQDGSYPVYIAENPFDQVHLMTVYRSYTELADIYWPVMIVMLVTICLFAVLAQYPVIRPLEACMILALITGVTITFLIPPFNGPDDMSHFKMVYWLSNQFSGQYDGAGPDRLRVMAGDLSQFRNTTTVITIERYNNLVEGLFRHQIDHGLYEVIGYSNVLDSASLWTYLPAVMGFQLFRFLGYNFMTTIMGARWCSLVGSLLLLYLGIRKCPVGRNGLMVIVLFPVLLQQIASCSYDAMIIAFAFLFIGYAMHILYDKDRSAVDYLITMLAGLLLGINKHGVYLPILGILLIPFGARIVRMDRRRLMAAAAACAAAIVAALVYLANAVPNYSGAECYTLHDLLNNPMLFVHLLEHTIVNQGDRLFSNMISDELGALQVSVPRFMVIAICVILFYAWRADRDTGRQLGRHISGYLLLIQILGMLMICAAFTLAMTQREETIIEGLQGRYFLPYFILMHLVAEGLIPRGSRVTQGRVLYGMSLVHMAAMGFILVYVFANNG